ncbi:MAG: class I SAM-dependent methyltransferase [Haloferacaceae archaeon]
MERERWNERYASGEYDPREYPSPLLEEHVDWHPTGRALDVATGQGRNALFLAERGYDVDAIDVAPAALETARARADERGVDVAWIAADVDDYAFPAGEYDVITVSFFAALDRLPDLKEALAPDGVLLYEHHLRTTEPVERGPSGDRYRLRSNDLLRACLDLTVLRYDESTREVDGDRAAVASLVARNTHGGTQAYPDR